MKVASIACKRTISCLVLTAGLAANCCWAQDLTGIETGRADLKNATNDEKAKLLVNLDVKLYDRDQTGGPHTDVTTTGDMGSFQVVPVWPGWIKIVIVGRNEITKSDGITYDVFLQGEGRDQVVPNIKHSSAIFLSHNDMPQPPAGSAAANPHPRTNTVYLLRIDVLAPRSRQRKLVLRNVRQNSSSEGNRIELLISDRATGNPIRGVSVHVIDPATGKEVENVARISGGELILTAVNGAGFFVNIEAPNYSRRVLLLYGRDGAAELYDEKDRKSVV